ncbi:MAG: hypothetical protein ACRER5_16310 [Pseudomonas sp.]
MRDVFRPKHEPARSIYDAFQNEAAKRDSRPLHEAFEAESHAVWKAACESASIHGLRPPTLAEVDDACTYASGSIDFGAKWAFAIVDVMNRNGAPHG